MKRAEKLWKALSDLPDDLILEAAREEKYAAKKTVFLRWGALAACLCVV